jgi:hypothetical protein
MLQHCSLIPAAAVVAAFLVAGHCPGAQERRNNQASEKTEFKGKVVVVKVRAGERREAAVLKNVGVRRLGEHPFLVGKILFHTGDSPDEKKRKGTLIWLPLEDIAEIAEYADLSDLKEKEKIEVEDE